MGETKRTTCTCWKSHARGMYPCETIADPVRSVCDASAASCFDVPAHPMRRRSNGTVSCACIVIPCLRSCVSVAHASLLFRFARVRRRQMDELLRSCCKGMRGRSRSPAHPSPVRMPPFVLPATPRKGGHSIRPRSSRVGYPLQFRETRCVPSSWGVSRLLIGGEAAVGVGADGPCDRTVDSSSTIVDQLLRSSTNHVHTCAASTPSHVVRRGTPAAKGRGRNARNPAGGKRNETHVERRARPTCRDPPRRSRPFVEKPRQKAFLAKRT